MLHSLNGLKVQKSMKNCRFLKIDILRLTAHQMIGSKQTNNKFRCFSEVHQPNIRILAILFIWKCVLLNFIYWLTFQKWVGGGGLAPPALSPAWALSPLLSTCKEPILLRGQLQYYYGHPFHVLRVSTFKNFHCINIWEIDISEVVAETYSPCASLGHFFPLVAKYLNYFFLLKKNFMWPINNLL